MSAEPAVVAVGAPEPGRGAILTRPFIRVMMAQATFGFAWSIYFLVPKYLTSALHASPAVVGGLTSLSGVASMLSVPLVGTLIDRHGRRRWMTAGAALLVLAAFGFVFSREVGPLLYAAQAAQGVAFVLVFNAAGTLVADFAPPARIAEAIGLFGAANLSMNAIAPATAELVAEAHGWTAVFGMSAAGGVFAMIVSRGVPEPRLPASTMERSELSEALTPPLLRVYAVSAAMAVSFAALAIMHQPWAIANGVEDVRDFFIGFTCTAIAVRVSLGRVTDRVGSIRVARVAMFFYAGVPVVLVLLGPRHLLLVGACLGLCHGALYPAVSALGLERCAATARGRVLSFSNGAFNGGIALASVGLGALAEHVSYTVAFGTASVITLLGATLLLGSSHPAEEAH